VFGVGGRMFYLAPGRPPLPVSPPQRLSAKQMLHNKAQGQSQVLLFQLPCRSSLPWELGRVLGPASTQQAASQQQQQQLGPGPGQAVPGDPAPEYCSPWQPDSLCLQ